ncbi:tetratricopeptide repeat protein [Chitiniphilus eburneus]|uniref:Tetratricopeptide repeat protein n=1 Tax=Chitiniphilus eburneus TaxID=2571148 RepID=A0A4U0QCW3_9NEIS|nr:tetratricopeptide repeat protein [Chitiniphilus eburneus]TJZ79156.1 tetratricopeptide repeat protein [Chitiniphilus eburneus]
MNPTAATEPSLAQRIDAFCLLNLQVEPDVVARANALLAEARSNNQPMLVGRMMIARSSALFRTGARQQGLEAIREAQRYISHNHLDTLKPSAQDRQAMFCYDLAEYLRALDAWLKCLEYASEQNAMLWCARAYVGVGKVYDALNDYSTARYFHGVALQLAEKENSSRLICQIEINLASVAYKLHSYDQALEALNRASECLDALDPDTEIWQAEIVSYYGLVYFERGEYRQAEHYLNQAHEIYRSHGNRWGETQVLLNLGRTYRKLGRTEEALEYLLKADQLAQQANLSPLMLQTEELLSQAYLETGRYREALTHHKRMHEVIGRVNRSQGSPVRLSKSTAARLKALEHQLELERVRIARGLAP